MGERSRDNHLMSHIVELLSALETSRLDADRLLSGDGEALLQTLPQNPGFQAALENLRFMEEMPGGVLIYYADGGEEIVYANRALLRIFQCGSMEEFRTLTGNSFRGIVCPEDLDEVERSIREQVARSKYDLDYVEYRVRRRDGQIRWIEDYGHFVRGGSGRDIFYVFLSDATGKRNRRIIERTLLLSEKRERERQLALLTEEYDKERSQLNQEYLRRLKVIEGLSANYETILYGELDCDQIRPYRLSSRTSRMFGEDRGLRSFSGYLADYVSIWVHPEEREAVGAALNVEAIRRKLLTDGSFYVNYRVVEDGEEKYLQLQLVDVGGERRASQLVMGSRRMDEDPPRDGAKAAAGGGPGKGEPGDSGQGHLSLQYVPRYPHAHERHLWLRGPGEETSAGAGCGPELHRPDGVLRPAADGYDRAGAGDLRGGVRGLPHPGGGPFCQPGGSLFGRTAPGNGRPPRGPGRADHGAPAGGG